MSHWYLRRENSKFCYIDFCLAIHWGILNVNLNLGVCGFFFFCWFIFLFVDCGVFFVWFFCCCFGWLFYLVVVFCFGFFWHFSIYGCLELYHVSNTGKLPTSCFEDRWSKCSSENSRIFAYLVIICWLSLKNHLMFLYLSLF